MFLQLQISANVTTVAGISSDVTSVAGIVKCDFTCRNSSNINTVAGSISNVNLVGGSIANVNTVASNISSVNSFANQYRVGSSDPSTSLDAGDLAYNTTGNVLKFTMALLGGNNGRWYYRCSTRQYTSIGWKLRP